jgi:hypothetical protein
MNTGYMKFLFLVLITALVYFLPKTAVAQGGSSTNTRPTKYYVVDRVRTNTDFTWLATQGINTAVVDFHVGPKPDSVTVWDSVVNAAAVAGINIVIWPDGHQGSDVGSCRWETPFDDSDINNGTDYLVNIKGILDHLGNNPHVIGIVTAHEPVWIQNASTEASCNEDIAGMTTIKTQIHNYIDNTVHRDPSYQPFKVWNYIDNIYNISNISDYSAANQKAQIAGIMDVAVIWQHCAGFPTNAGDGSACEGSGKYTALGGINWDRNNIIKPLGLEGTVEEVFIIQTFNQGTTGDYGGKFSLSELENYSRDFLNSSALDGYGYYTWDEGWYTGNLKKYNDLQPAIRIVYDSWVNHGGSIPTPTPTPIPGDIWGPAGIPDGHVDMYDFDKMRTSFGSPYTIFDYNDLVGNFGLPAQAGL